MSGVVAMVAGGSKWQPLHSALIFGKLNEAKCIYDESGNDKRLLTSRNSKGWAALHFASHSGVSDSVSLEDNAFVTVLRRVPFSDRKRMMSTKVPIS